VKLVLFEDKRARDFYPLTDMRPVWELRCGLGTLRQRIEWRLGLKASSGICREEIKNFAASCGLPFPALDKNDEVLLVNARLLEFDSQEILSLETGQALLEGEELIAVRLQTIDFHPEKDDQFMDIQPAIIETQRACKLVSRLWELVDAMPDAIAADVNFFPGSGMHRASELENQLNCSQWINPEAILIASDAKLAPQVVIDASRGPVVIDKGVEILPFSFIEGPCYIGPDCKLKAGTRIYEGCHLGPVCRVAGEIAETVIQGYSNKQHDGFLGHAYLGEWCNLGADTNNSDLKNNYSEVVVSILGQRVQTASRFVGLMLGDHSKTAINTMFNTGTVVGIFANIWGGGFPDKEIPAFSWGGPQDEVVSYDIEKAVSTARIVKGRRNEKLDAVEEELIRFNHSRQWDSR
jgi:UDP-N-acetylglucosamine diphosphorylase / glucose-1-phosphate thymidylyltransferase / UDP-N-acetylgalactosamine diphosphorylase / glucosamine-1-phosphate N-acetyltransferase / galactosamine-1-phosphate N-acetyltransferase